MSYFAVLAKDPKSVAVVRCHINFWVLQSPVGLPVFFIDVGLGLTGAAVPEGLSLALPVGVEVEDFSDLMEETKKNAYLIFGEPATVRDNVLELGEPDAQETLNLSGLHGKRQDQFSGRDYSVWDLHPLNWCTGGETYVRCRFRVSSFRRHWLRQESGALVDLRVCDVRESVSERNLIALAAWIVPIQTLNMFVIVPASLKCRAANPTPRHVRMLEGEAWSSYLQRSARSLRTRKLAVYYWRGGGEPTKYIDKRNPFRAFLDLTEERVVLGWRSYLVFAVIVLAVVRFEHVQRYASSVTACATGAVSSWVGGVGIFGLLAFVWAYRSDFQWALSLKSKLRGLHRDIDAKFHRP